MAASLRAETEQGWTEVAASPGNAVVGLRAGDTTGEVADDDEKLTTLECMGFPISRCKCALGLAQGDVEQVLFLCLCLCVSCLYRISRHFEQTVHNGFQT